MPPNGRIDATAVPLCVHSGTSKTPAETENRSIMIPPTSGGSPGKERGNHKEVNFRTDPFLVPMSPLVDIYCPASILVKAMCSSEDMRFADQRPSAEIEHPIFATSFRATEEGRCIPRPAHRLYRAIAASIRSCRHSSMMGHSNNPTNENQT